LTDPTADAYDPQQLFPHPELKPMRSKPITTALSAIALVLSAAAGTAQAEVPENIYQQMVKIGPIVDPACTAKLYRGFMPANDYNSTATPLYPGITLARDVSFGPNRLDLADIFSATGGAGNRPVLIYVAGGGGNKIEQQNREANAFYDNVGRWATKNGMVGVLMQRHPGPSWDSGAKDVSTLIQWLQANVAKYQGNPERIFIWAHSAGNGPVGTYIGRPEVWGPKGVSLKGAIMMSGGWNAAPLPAVRFSPTWFMGAGTTCGSVGPASVDGAIKGPSGATPPPAGAAAGPPPGMGGAPDAQTLLDQSTLPTLKQSNVKLFLVSGELDIDVKGGMSVFYQSLHDELCKAGKDKCPTMLYAKRHNHMSMVFSPDSPDTSVSGPVLDWMRSVK
jgi:Carboxylesterase family